MTQMKWVHFLIVRVTYSLSQCLSPPAAATFFLCYAVHIPIVPVIRDRRSISMSERFQNDDRTASTVADRTKRALVELKKRTDE